MRRNEPSLFHREREQAVLAAVVGGVRAGRPAVVTVTGRPGFGQNALVRWAAQGAEALGLRVLRARATPAEREERHGVVAQLLTPLDGLADDTLRALAAGQLPDRPPGLTELLGAAREQPTLLVVEDSQWIDADSVGWLTALVRRSPQVPVALLASGSGVSAAGPDWLGVAAPAAVLTHGLVLRPLSEGDVSAAVALACGRTGEEAFTAAARQLTAGNPSILHETLCQFVRHGHEPVAARLPELRAISAEVSGDGVVRALRGLCAEAVAVVRALAVCGDLLDLPVVCRLAGLRSLAESRLWAELDATGVVVSTETGLRVAQAAKARVLEEMAANERSGLYARAAELAHLAGADDQDVARLLLRARPIGAPWALRALRRSSSVALRRGEHERAVGYLSRTLEEPLDPARRAELTLELAAAEMTTAPEAAVRHLDAIVRDPAGDRADLRVRAADLGLSCGDTGAMSRAVAAALPAADGTERDNLIALFWSADYTGRNGAELVSPEVPALPQDPASPAQAGIRAWQLAVHGVDLSTTRELARRALAANPATGGLPVLPRLAACQALCLTDDLEEAEGALGRLLAELRGGHLHVGAPLVLAVRADLRLRRGRLTAAEQDLDAAEQALPASGRPVLGVLQVRVLRVLLALESGRRDEARSYAGAPTPHGAQDSLHWPYLLFARAQVATVDGEHARAGDLLRECGRRMLSRHHVNPALLPWRSMAARAFHAVGEHDEARRLSAQELALTRRWGSASAMGWAELTASQLVPGERLLRAREVTDMLRNGSTRLVYARALAELAAAELAEQEGNHRTATATLDELSTLTTAHPDGPMAERARDLAGEMRPLARPELGTPSAWAALTQTERHTAELAAHGRSNQNIADMLSVSRRTVELRLSRAYKKLRIGSRQELRALVRSMEGRGTDAA